MRERRPRIGITTYGPEGERFSFSLPRWYTDAVAAAGGMPVLLVSGAVPVEEVLDSIDARSPVIVLFSTLDGVERALEASRLPLTRLIIGHVPEAPGREPLHRSARDPQASCPTIGNGLRACAPIRWAW